jgi:hypothetical protein
MRIKSNKLTRYLGYSVFFLMIFFAGAHQNVRYAILLGLFLFISFGYTVKKNGFQLRIAKELLFFTLFYVSIGVFFTSYGFLAGNPGAMASFNPYVVYPIIFTLILHFSCSEQFLWGLARTIVIAAIATSLYGLVVFGAKFGVLPQYLDFDIGVVFAISTESESVGMHLNTILPLIFITPYLISFVILRYLGGVFIINNITIISAIVLCLVFAVLTRRRSLWVVIIMAPLLTILFFNFKICAKKILIKQFVMLGVFILLSGCFWIMLKRIGLDLLDHDFNDRLLSIFSGISDSSIAHKEDQTILMLNEWRDKPLFGYGHGAVVKGISSSDDSPWAYESSYSLLLHNVGLSGFLLYASGILWLYIKAIKIIRQPGRWSDAMIATLVGLTSLLLANATNPYLGQIDSLWMLFYPLAIINMVSMRKKVSAAKIA